MEHCGSNAVCSRGQAQSGLVQNSVVRCVTSFVDIVEDTPCFAPFHTLKLTFSLLAAMLARFRMQAREQDWNKEEDCKMLVQRLSEQSDALARDDFSEVDLKSLTANGWKWPRFFIRNVWQRLLAANVEPNITDIDRGFRSA